MSIYIYIYIYEHIYTYIYIYEGSRKKYNPNRRIYHDVKSTLTFRFINHHQDLDMK